MRKQNWVVAASLLLSLSATAQQSAEPAPPALNIAQSAAPQVAGSATMPQLKTAQMADARKPDTLTPPPVLPAPTTMDQVVDRVIVREQGLIKMLSKRTPVIETYLQNLTLDPQLGPVPKDDRYFLGRMDLDETIDRKDYLQDQSMERHLLGGVTKMFKMQ